MIWYLLGKFRIISQIIIFQIYKDCKILVFFSCQPTLDEVEKNNDHTKRRFLTLIMQRTLYTHIRAKKIDQMFSPMILDRKNSRANSTKQRLINNTKCIRLNVKLGVCIASTTFVRMFKLSLRRSW